MIGLGALAPSMLVSIKAMAVWQPVAALLALLFLWRISRRPKAAPPASA